MPGPNDKNHSEDDFSFPEEGEYQFDETHDFDSTDTSFDDTEDFGFTADEPVEEVEPLVTTKASDAKTGAKKSKQVAGKKSGGMKKILLLIILLLIVIGGGYFMLHNKPQSTASMLRPVSNKLAPLTSTNHPTPILSAQAPTIPVTQVTVKPATSQQEPPQVTVPLNTPPVMPVTAPSTTTQTETVTNEATATSQQSQALLQQVTALNTASQTRLATLEGKLADMNTVVTQLKSDAEKNAESMKNMEKSITVLATQTQRLNQALTLLVQAAAANTSSRSEPVPVRRPVVARQVPSRAVAKTMAYRVDAVIPGRAWLRDQNGKIIAVELGDKVPGYGTVVNIDSRRGVVGMSNGVQFR